MQGSLRFPLSRISLHFSVSVPPVLVFVFIVTHKVVISSAIHTKAYGSSIPYFFRMRSSFASIGSPSTAKKITVALPWITFIGKPLAYIAKNAALLIPPIPIKTDAVSSKNP